jgi:hypothetical protein
MGSWRILMTWVPVSEIKPIEGKITARQERNFTVQGGLPRPCPRFEHLTYVAFCVLRDEYAGVCPIPGTEMRCVLFAYG